MSAKPSRPEAYRHLVEAYGAGTIADALLTKWLADPDGDARFERLWRRIQNQKIPAKPPRLETDEPGCPVCGRDVRANSFGRPRVYCTEECMWLAAWLRRLQRAA